jgi:hypothetical protein
MAGPFYAAVVTYVLMVLAFYWHRHRGFHITVMAGVILFDLAMPFYLVSTRDWYTRLIVHEDILSFGIWTHFGLLVTLFVLYAMQIQTALKFIRARQEAAAESRQAHRAQGKGILLVRALVIVSGAILAEPVVS